MSGETPRVRKKELSGIPQIRGGEEPTTISERRRLSHHCQHANRSPASRLILGGGDDDKRAGCRQRGQASGAFDDIVSVEGDLAGERPVGAEVSRGFDCGGGGGARV